MNAGQEKDFASLRRLLKLKRHEQPPPRYFNDFSSQVIARIKLNPRGDSELALNPLTWAAPWMERLVGSLMNSPFVAGAFAACICLLLVVGLIYSEVAKPAPFVVVAPPAPEPRVHQAPPAAFALEDPAALSFSTNPVAPPPVSLFDAFPIQPARASDNNKPLIP